MRNSKKKNNNITPVVFQIWSDELKNRADAYFYQPIFKELYKTLQTSKYSISKLSKIIDGGLIKGILPNQEEKNGDVNIVQISSVRRDGVIDVSDCITAKREVYDGKHILKRNDILVVITGATIGKVGFWQEDKPDYYLGGDIVKFQVKKDFDPIFIWAYLRSELGQKQILRHITGATNKHLSPDDVANIQIPLLPMEKQKKVSVAVQEAYEQKKKKETEIFKILSSIDDFVLGELGIDMPRGGAEQVFQIWSDEIQTRLDPSYFRPIFKMLDKIFSTTKYNVKTLKNLSTKITSGATPLSGGDAYTDQSNGIPFVRSGNINPDNEIDFNSLLYVKPEIHNKKLKSSQLKKGDLMIAIVGATIGQVSVYENDREANINQAIALIRLDEQVNSEYAKEFLYSKIGQMQLDRIKRPVARANINLDEVGSLQVIYPSKDKQNEMVDKIRKIRAKATALRQEAESIVAGAEKQIEQMILA